MTTATKQPRASMTLCRGAEGHAECPRCRRFLEGSLPLPSYLEREHVQEFYAVPPRIRDGVCGMFVQLREGRRA